MAGAAVSLPPDPRRQIPRLDELTSGQTDVEALKAEVERLRAALEAVKAACNRGIHGAATVRLIKELAADALKDKDP